MSRLLGKGLAWADIVLAWPGGVRLTRIGRYPVAE